VGRYPKMWEFTDEGIKLNLKIRKFIIKQTEPFCIVDIKVRAEMAGFTNFGMVLTVLDDMYDEGLVKYGKVPCKHPESSEWAFYVA